MNTKQKLLDALDCALDEISEERLIDILVDAYEAKKDRISQLEGENCHERLMLQSERENMHREYRRMRTDPLYGAMGDYFFLVNQHKVRVTITTTGIVVYERVKNFDYVGQQVSHSDWEH